MLHSISKYASATAVIIIGLGSGYFGTAAYYEKNPQSVAQSGELNGKTTTIGWTHKDILLAISPWENWRAWSNRESEVMHSISNDNPSSEAFQNLKTNLISGISSGKSVKKTCAAIYIKTNSDSDKTKFETDIKKYCGLRYTPTPAAKP